MKTMYVCPNLLYWKDLQLAGNVPIPIAFGGLGHSVAILPIYDSIEAYRADNPEGEPWIITVESREVQP